MNDDLISRSALRVEIESYVMPILANNLMGAADAYHRILHLLDDAPAVDAVPVVRCKDCKHSRERNEYERVYLVDGVLICTSPDATDDCWQAVWEDHWCKCGERRSDE